VLLAALLTGCAGTREEPSGWVTLSVEDRPVQVFVPGSYASGQPLVVGLHGYTSSGAELESYFRIEPQAQQRGFVYAIPEGTLDRRGDRFWNATDACCGAHDGEVDDSAYLSKVIVAVREAYGVGPVYLIGHSNGGFMAHRMACDHADQITAIASLAGAGWLDPDACDPSGPVGVLQVHGDADTSIRYEGGTIAGVAYPGAERTISDWQVRNACETTAGTATLDLDRAEPGAETTTSGYTCPGGVRVELWRMAGSGHVPALSDGFTPALLDFFGVIHS
jgi:polyhydroxybutyrate depolymerase